MRISSGTELDRGKCESRSDEKTLRSNEVVGHHQGTGVVHESWNRFTSSDQPQLRAWRRIPLMWGPLRPRRRVPEVRDELMRSMDKCPLDGCLWFGAVYTKCSAVLRRHEMTLAGSSADEVEEVAKDSRIKLEDEDMHRNDGPCFTWDEFYGTGSRWPARSLWKNEDESVQESSRKVVEVHDWKSEEEGGASETEQASVQERRMMQERKKLGEAIAGNENDTQIIELCTEKRADTK